MSSVLLVDCRVRGLLSHQQNPLAPISEDAHYSLERKLNSLDEPAPYESSRRMGSYNLSFNVCIA